MARNEDQHCTVSGHRNLRFACSKAAVGKPAMKGSNVKGTSSKRAPAIDHQEPVTSAWYLVLQFHDL